jgi:hypothetical protein
VASQSTISAAQTVQDGAVWLRSAEAAGKLIFDNV